MRTDQFAKNISEQDRKFLAAVGVKVEKAFSFLMNRDELSEVEVFCEKERIVANSVWFPLA